MSVELHPRECNLCGGKVIYTSNSMIYGRPYGSGMMYYCTQCGAYAGTSKSSPTKAMGILANKAMRELKDKCHNMFNDRWQSKEGRELAYQTLAKELGIPPNECRFGWFDLDMLNRAYEILKESEDERTPEEEKG